MPDQFSPEFKSEAMEADMQRMAEDLQKHQESPEASNFNEREVLKRSIQAMAPSAPVRDDEAKVQDDDDPLSNLNSAPPAAKLEVEQLLSLAFKDGVVKASEEAMKSNPFVLDAFHDALTGQLYDEFKKRGIIK
ncbi:MAG: hypothetical protein AAB787_00495 [Patescibacteria group bacterium]